MLAAVDQHTALVLALCAVALVGNYIFWIENLRLGFRDRRYSMPVGSLFLFLPHDGTFVAMYPHWFHTLHHWFPELWWCGLCVTVLMELTFLVMLLKFGRAELAPRASQAQFTGIILFGLALSTIAWLALKSVMQDELFLAVFGLTIFWCMPFNFALMASRGAAVGQSRLAWCGFLLMPLCYWPATWILAPGFHGLTWNALGAACVAGGLANLWLISVLDRERVAPAPPFQRRHGGARAGRNRPEHGGCRGDTQAKPSN